MTIPTQQKKKKEEKSVETHSGIKCRCCSCTKSIVRNWQLKRARLADTASSAGGIRLRTLDTMTHSVQGVYLVYRYYMCVCVCVYPIPNVLPILFHEIPSGPWRGSLLQLQVYLKLFLVYLMNGCLSKEQGGSAKNASRTLMCVFKGENRGCYYHLYWHCNQEILVTMANEI